MQNGKILQRKLNRTLFIAIFIEILFFIVKSIDRYSIPCDENCQERKYAQMVDLGIFNKYGEQFYKKLISYKLKPQEIKVLSVNELFGKKITKVVFIERMQLDYNKLYKELKLNEILKGKEFCQIIIAEYNDGNVEYLIGRCEYDLMGFTKSYNKFGVDLLDKIQYLLPKDQLYLTYSVSDREKFTFTSKDFKNISPTR